MTLQQINYVLKVASVGSMNKAAEELYISQPTLTSAIRDVEKEIGIVIFSRNNRGVSLTVEGAEFLEKARNLYQEYELLLDSYSEEAKAKQKFAVSTQHYSFAVKAFVDTIKPYDTLNYEFAVRETKTYEVIQDVALGRSDIGILYESSYNQKYITKLLLENGLEFNPLGECKAYVYLHKSHPLANNEDIKFEELEDYPCLSFEQGESGSAFLAEEILSDRKYNRVIKANDRATMLKLMIGVWGYTLCSGIISEELNGSDYKVVPFHSNKENPNYRMTIGYIIKKGSRLSAIGEKYICEIQKYL